MFDIEIAINRLVDVDGDHPIYEDLAQHYPELDFVFKELPHLL